MTYYKYSSNNNKTQQSASQKRRKNKQKNKSREVKSWDDIDETGNQIQQNQQHQKSQKTQIFIPPKYTQDEIKRMKWADIDEMSDEDFYGYFVDIDE